MMNIHHIYCGNFFLMCLSRVIMLYTLNLYTACVRAKSFQACLTLCNLMDCSPPGFSAHRILQARILEWVSMPSSKGSSRPRDRTWVRCHLLWQAGSLPLVPPGKPKVGRGNPNKDSILLGVYKYDISCTLKIVKLN